MTRKLRTPLVFLAALAALLLLHTTLLGLPYYRDEAGYFIPAARDLYADGSFIPHSTPPNARPPLVMAWLALAWKLFGFEVLVARVAMLAVAALALAGLFRLAGRVTNARVAAATVVCTALYPVFFAQSPLAHPDMMAAALTLWALSFYLPPREAAPPQPGADVSQPDATPLRGDTTALRGDTTALRRDATPLRRDATPLRRDATPLRDDTTPLRDDTMALRDDTMALRRDTMALRDDAKPLRVDAEALRDDAKASRDGAEGLRGGAKASRGGGEGLREAGNTRFRFAFCVFLLALAALARETAVLVPFVLCGWELLCLLSGRRGRLAALVCLEGRRPNALRAAALLLACVPLALWLAYHRAETGYAFGNPEYLRHNVESTLSLGRVLDAGWRRLGHVTHHMNLWALTLAGLAAMFLKPRRDGDAERPRISVPVQLLFAALVLAHVSALSIVGGAVLARHMLPVLPLVVLIWVSTLWRRVPAWPLAVALVCGAFAYRVEVNPAYGFPLEENLAYRDFVLLHRDAARFLEERYPEARVLTAWPATDGLRNPYYGYASRPLRVFAVENFLRDTLERAARQKSEYDVALLYSTHGGLGLEDAARTLGARIVFQKESDGQWVAVVEKQ